MAPGLLALMAGALPSQAPRLLTAIDEPLVALQRGRHAVARAGEVAWTRSNYSLSTNCRPNPFPWPRNPYFMAHAFPSLPPALATVSVISGGVNESVGGCFRMTRAEKVLSSG